MLDNEDYLELVAEVRGLLEENGLGEVADPLNYANENEGFIYEPSPREYVIGMLKAFDRHLSLLDSATLDDAVDNINVKLDGKGYVGEVVIDLTKDQQRYYKIEGGINLREELHDLEELRGNLRELIIGLIDPGDEPDDSFDDDVGPNNSGGAST